jgi:transcriptional regulator with XRE-family HTH domain
VSTLPTSRLLAMDFPERLATLRKERQLTQQQLADKVDVHISQVRRYESGESQPTLDVIRKLAIALSVSADMLIFDGSERGPDEELRLQFEAICQFTPEEKQVAKAVLESLILKHDATRFQQRTAGAHGQRA